MLPRLKPHEFYDLVIQVAIVRPGRFKATWCTPICAAGRGWSPSLSPLLRRSMARQMSFMPCWEKRRVCRSSRSRRCSSQWSQRNSRMSRQTSCAAPWPRFAMWAPSAGSKASWSSAWWRAAMIGNLHRTASSRSRVSAPTAFRKATPRASRSSSTSRHGSNVTTPRSSRRLCSIRSPWASMHPRRSCAAPASMASRSALSISMRASGTTQWSATRQETLPCASVSGRPRVFTRPKRTGSWLRDALAFRAWRHFQAARGSMAGPCARSRMPMPSAHSGSTGAARFGKCGACRRMIRSRFSRMPKHRNWARKPKPTCRKWASANMSRPITRRSASR